MNEKELRDCAVCAMCRRKVMAAGMPLFYRVRIERYGIDMNAVKRQSGMEMLMNGHVSLAQVMGPNEDMTVPLMEPITFTVCESCSTAENRCVAVLAEMKVKE